MSFLLPLFVVHLLAVMTPGPDFLIVSKTAMSSSRRAAMATALGVTLGVAFWVVLVLLGLHLLFERFAWLQTTIKFAGGAYLVYLGALMLKASFGPEEMPESPTGPAPKSDASAFASGLLTNLSNPKVLVYFGSIFATFLPGTIAVPAKAAVFALVTLETCLWFVLLALLFSLPVPRRAYQRANRWIDRIAGVTFGGFGLRLLFSGRH